jgi:hypothetical protein
VEQPEIEVLVGEAENRVERLRSLYDQYFMGIERIEPQTARKDVERRIQILRKTQIRNTALRFRFQNVLLRYNTFSAHWLRICRQIEDGTYKHHLRKAKERFDPHAQAREAHAARKKAAALEFGDTEPPGPPSFEMDDDMDVDVDFEDGVDAPDVRAALRSYAIPQEAVAASVAGRALGSMASMGVGSAQPAPKRPPMRDASLDRGTDPAPAPIPSNVPGKPAAPPVPARAAAPPLPGARPGAPPVPSRAPASPAAAGKSIPPPVPNRPGAPGAAKPAPPSPPLAAAKPPVPVAARPAAAPVAAKPAPAPAPAVARPAATKPETSGPDERTRQLYSKYVEMRRSLGESTSAISMDSMARSLSDSEKKLRQKHPGKTVEFDVQVKDGKTVLKPIVR